MGQFSFNIAGLEFEVSVSGPQAERFGAYESYPSRGGPADVRIDLEVIPGFGKDEPEGPTYPAFETVRFSDTELVLSRKSARGHIDIAKDGKLHAHFQSHQAPSGLEAIIRIAASLALPHRDTLILHSSSVAGPEGALVFSGVSGAGKSTISTMLAEHCGALKLADELLFVSKSGGSWSVTVAPFKGSEGLPHGESRELASLNFLIQAPEHHRRRIAPAAAMNELCRHVVTYARAPKTSAKTLSLVADLVSSVPCYELEFSKDPSVGEVLGITCE
tara:strand:- start:28432 stop:29256 length:825 start_codon:yes stop_codon:yes gene_type:complete